MTRRGSVGDTSHLFKKMCHMFKIYCLFCVGKKTVEKAVFSKS